MTLIQLTYLVALDTHRHFRRAAAQCRVSQPSLSAQIRKLEEELGVPLFDRDRKPLVPTRIGERVVAQARIVLAEVQGVRELVQRGAGALTGDLRVGVSPSLAAALVPRVAGRFAGRHPDIALAFEEVQAQALPALIRRDVFDAGLESRPPTVRGLVEEVLFDEPLVGYVAVGHRLHARRVLSPSDLPPEDVWLPAAGSPLREQVERLCGIDGAGPRPRGVRFDGESLDALRRLVERSGGLTVLPWLFMHGEAASDRASVKPFHDPPPVRTVRLVYARASLKKPLINAFAETIRSAVLPVLGNRTWEIGHGKS